MYYHSLQAWCALDGKAFHGRDEEKKQLYQAHQDFPTINQVPSQDSINTFTSNMLWCRYMQTVCCHSKLTASVSLANHVPLVKKALEVFVYRFYKKISHQIGNVYFFFALPAR